MSDWYPYRFKTESEFLKDFGSDWRITVRNFWNSSGNMDYLYGQPYPFFIKKDDYWLFGVDNWSVSWDMLTENKPKEPNYKPRKIERTYE